MLVYILLFTVPLIWYLHGRNGGNSSMLAIFMFGFALFVGMSDMLGGYDRYIYGEAFASIADVTTSGQAYGDRGVFNYFPGESGYIWLNIIISWFTANRYIFILVLTLLIYVLLYQSLRDYCVNYPYALMLFMALWFYFSFTYLRQVLGATLAWLSIRYILKRQLWKFLLVWFIASTLHKSALVFLPIYFVPIRKYSVKTILAVMGVALVIGISPIPNAIFHAYGDVNSRIAKNAQYNASGGFRVDYLLEAAFFLYFIIKSYASIPNRRVNILMLNMALVFCVMLLFFIRSENGGRLSWYYMIGIISTITYICTQGDRRQVFGPMMIVVSLLLYVRIYVAWQIPLSYLAPYKTFLSDGVRENDQLCRRYEYDHMYDVNKLYRAPLRFKTDFNIGNISVGEAQVQDNGL